MGLNPNETTSPQRGPDGRWYQLTNNGRGGRGLTIASDPNVMTPDKLFQKLKDELIKEMDEMNKRATDFDAAHPFAFDEALARKSSEERYNPYYESELDDFLKGIRTRIDTTQGQKDLLTELNTVQAGQEAVKLQQAIDDTQQGFSDVGLFFSGAQKRATANVGITGEAQATTREATYNTNKEQQDIELGQIGNEKATGERKIAAAKATDVQTDVEKQKAEEEARWATEKAQYIGYPYINRSTSGLQGLLEQAFQ